MFLSITDLAFERTKLANHRTYLSYMRTGFVIASIAGLLKKIWIALFGLLMIIVSTIHYIIINKMLLKKKIQDNRILDYIPIIYIILSIGALYLQFYS